MSGALFASGQDRAEGSGIGRSVACPRITPRRRGAEAGRALRRSLAADGAISQASGAAAGAVETSSRFRSCWREVARIPTACRRAPLALADRPAVVSEPFLTSSF
jgi:hypothetical protein